MSAFQLVQTGHVLDRFLEDFGAAREALPFDLRLEETVWDKAAGLYRPPGLWARFKGDRWKAGAPMLFWFPEPYHPVEAVAAFFGFGGRKCETGPLTEQDWLPIRNTQALRYAGWASYTKHLAQALELSDAQTRVLYHLFTPLRTNGCDAETSAVVYSLRARLYDACGFDAPTVEWSEAATRYPADAPSRMQFWGEECQGRIEL